MMERTRFDLLIAPERRGGGRALVEEFRRVRPGAKVVLLTTDLDVGEPLVWRDAVARVKKPFDLEEFRAIVGRLLGEVKETNGSAR
jgi:DNA-binding NtrC family response regulator